MSRTRPERTTTSPGDLICRRTILRGGIGRLLAGPFPKGAGKCRYMRRLVYMAATFSADRALTLRAGIADSESRGVEFLRHFQEFLGSLKILGQAFQIPGLRWFGLRIAR